MTEAVVKIVQITDCHLGEKRGDEILAMNPDDSLSDVLALINQQHKNVDLLLATGDLANEAALPAYQRIYQQLNENVNYPFAWLPGNHDDPALMAQLGESVNIKTHALGSWLIVLLNSRVPGRIYGRFSEEELAFLDETLSANSDKHIMLCMHHQPVPIGSQWMDNYIIRNAHDFWQQLENHPHVKIVAWGHVHQAFSDDYQQVALLSAPSTCIQFTPGKRDFEVENSMPGYRWFELYADGSFSTQVERVAQKDYGVDLKSGGY